MAVLKYKDPTTGEWLSVSGGTGGGTELSAMYPVGSIYLSMLETDPATLFGFGVWEQIAHGRTLIGAGVLNGKEYAAGSEGGEAEHTLTVDEMPKHYHEGIHWGNPEGKEWSDPGSAKAGYALGVSGGNIVNAHWVTGYSGGSQPHNNMPPYLTVYMWQRIA